MRTKEEKEEWLSENTVTKALDDLDRIQQDFSKMDKESKEWYTQEETARIFHQLCLFGNRRKNTVFKEPPRKAKLICKKQTFSVPVVKHHVNETDLVWIPYDIHIAVNHVRGDGKLEGVIG